jgi:hypothetical protein
MPSLRFDNPALQLKLLELLKSLPFRPELRQDGEVVCTDDQWPQVNALAHRVRDSCFRWYFSWCESEESTAEMEQHLIAKGLRFEVEHHEDRKVFLVPHEDRDKHTQPGDVSGPVACSFCRGRNVDRERMYATGTVAICDECIAWLYADLRGSDGGTA